MTIVYDAMEFERLGRMLYHSGWVEFFKTGPHNEPAFPLLIGFSMRVGDYFAISYQKVQTIIQIFILFSSQLLALMILRRLQISRSITAFIILYMGISPALVNATFSLFSEIVSFPFILAIILVGVRCWESVLSHDYKKIIVWSAYFSLVFIAVTSIKAMFEYVFIAFMVPYFALIVKSVYKKEKKVLVGTLLFLLTTVFLFQGYLVSYKSLNRKYNGHFMLADRGPYILYGNAAKRSEPLTFRRFFACLAFVPGDGVCYKLCDKKDCAFWDIFTVENYGRHSKLKELQESGVPASKIDFMMIRLAKEKILERPFQQTLLLFIESFKIFFWESTLVSFVSYPPWLQSIFEFTPFKNAMRLLLSLITFTSVVCVTRYVIRERGSLFCYKGPQGFEARIFFFGLILIAAYTALYALFMITTRAALPLGPLFLVMIAFTIHKTMFKQKLDGDELL